jgi:tetratricopeptide (TPR) repeat protein
MRKSMLSPVAIALTVAVAALGCGKVNELKARKTFKDANALYQQQEYKKAASKYEETLTLSPDIKIPCEGGDCSAAAHFYLANSYDNLYKPARQGEPENDANLQKAVEHYKIAAEKEENPKMKRLSLQYLAAAYGPDKLANPDEAEAAYNRIIEIAPSDPENYFALAKIHEDAGKYEEAEKALQKAKEMRPDDPQVYATIAGFYNRQGEFDKTVEALRERAVREPKNPEAYQVLAAFYWEKAYKDFRLNPKERAMYVEDGLKAADQALDLNKDYLEALAFKNLLLREKAKLTKDRKEYDALIAEANRLQQRAVELQKKKTAGVGPN